MRATFTRLGAVLRDGFRIWWLAPLVPLLAVVPEAAQHLAEIRIGMFDSLQAARVVADDPRRMVWGYLKIAGLLLAILATVRFWAARGSGRPWWDLRGVAWRNLLLAVLLMGLSLVPAAALKWAVGEARAGLWIDIAVTLATLPLLTLLAGGLAGDRELGLRAVFRNGWLTSLRIFVFAALVWAPLAVLHMMNHRWAMGGPDWAVWLLMGFDSLVVGLLATMAGAAIHHGYAPAEAISTRGATSSE